METRKENDVDAPVEPGDSIVIGAGVEGHLEAGQLYEVDVEGLAEILLLGPRQNVRQLVQASDQLGQTVQLGSCSSWKEVSAKAECAVKVVVTLRCVQEIDQEKLLLVQVLLLLGLHIDLRPSDALLRFLLLLLSILQRNVIDERLGSHATPDRRGPDRTGFLICGMRVMRAHTPGMCVQSTLGTRTNST